MRNVESGAVRSLLVGLSTLVIACSTSAPTVAREHRQTNREEDQAHHGGWTTLPLFAVWRRIGAYPRPDDSPATWSPALRFAVFESGRYAFAEDPTRWDSPLREGYVDQATLELIRGEIMRSGIFELTGTCYLAPDAPVLVTLARIGGREQILYWDEIESSSHGINRDPQPRHIAFKRVWYEVGATLAHHRPAQSTLNLEQFQPPMTWYVREPVQSE